MIGFVDVLTEYSCLRSTIKLNEYLKFMQDNQYEFVSISDYNLVGHYKFYKIAKKYNLKPIIGLKVLIESKELRKNYINLYALDNEGYHNLIQISSIQEMNGIVKDDDILKRNKGLALVTTAFDSDLEYYITCYKQEEALKELNRLKSLTNYFFLGIHPNSLQYETVCDDLIEFIDINELSCIPLSTSAYFANHDEAYNDLLLIGGYSQKDANLALRNKDQLLADYQDVDFVFDDLDYFISLFKDIEFVKEASIPKFVNKDNIDSITYLRNLAIKGLNKRIIENNIINKEQYLKRLEYELEIIIKMGYVDYILIVYEYVNYAKRNNIYVGPGRGSACSSLVVYSLYISEIDPLKYDLYFERFLNPERISMPDIDIDFEDAKKDLVLDHLAKRYGKNHVSYITTFQTFKAKNTVRDLFRINNIDEKYINSVLQNLDDPNYEETYKLHPELIKVIKEAHILEDLPRAFSTHPSGIIISSKNLYTDIPLKPGNELLYQSILVQEDLEDLGYLKFDFLSVSHMTFMREMLDRINQKEKFDINKISLADKKTFDLLASGDTTGLFQIEGANFTKFVVDMKMSSFDDLIALLALYRPGPIDMIPLYIKRKLGEPFKYLAPSLEPVLKSTFGIIVYQEQVMKILQIVASYSLGEADLIRRAIAKKDNKIIEEKQNDFINRGLKNGYSEDTLKELYRQIAKFSEYGFNKTHSVAYALFVYQLAYLKANYPSIFIAISLEKQGTNKNAILTYINMAKKYKINIYNPDINISELNYKEYKDGLIMPLNSINLVTNNIANEIINKRDKGYESFDDFYKKNELNNDILTKLIFGCSLDSFGLTKKQMIDIISNPAYQFINKDEIVFDQNDYSFDYLMQEELSSINCNLKYNLFNNYPKYKEAYKSKEVSELEENGAIVNVIGIILGKRVFKRKDETSIYFYDFLVNTDKIEINVFEEQFKEFSEALTSKKLVVIKGKINQYKGKTSLNLIKIKEL